MEKNYLQLNQIVAYTKSFNLSNLVWELVSSWDNFSKHTKASFSSKSFVFDNFSLQKYDFL